MIAQSLLTILVVIVAVKDWKEYRIPNLLCLIIFLLGGVFILTDWIFGQMSIENNFVKNLTISNLVDEPIKGFVIDRLLGAATGFFIMLLLSLMTGGIGAGDVKFTSSLGIWFGFFGIIEVMIYAFLFSGIGAVILLLWKKKKKTDGIAFAPFIALAVITRIIGGLFA